MNTHVSRICLASFLCCALSLRSQDLSTPTAPALPPQATGPVLWEITERAAHSSKWEASTTRLNPISGKAVVEKREFVELGTGLNFYDEAGQKWKPTRGMSNSSILISAPTERWDSRMPGSARAIVQARGMKVTSSSSRTRSRIHSPSARRGSTCS